MRSRSLLPLSVVVMLLTALALWGSGWLGHSAPDSRQLVSQARSALYRAEYQSAEELARSVSRDDPLWAQAALIAGEAAIKLGCPEAAYEYLRSIPRDGSRESVLAAVSRGELDREAGRLSGAVEEFRYALEQSPGQIEVHVRLAFLLGMTGQRWEASPHFEYLLLTRNSTLEELVILADLERPIEQPDLIRRYQAAVPDDVLVMLGAAAHAMTGGHFDEARELLTEVVQREPHLLAAQAMLGELLVDGPDAEFAAWEEQLPPEAEAHPEIWFVRGMWARQAGELQTAARCFWETLRLVPQHRRGTYQLGQVLIAMGDSRGESFTRRAGLYYELTKLLDDILRTEGRREEFVRRAVELFEETGREQEALAWSLMAAHYFPQANWPREVIGRLGERIHERTPFVARDANLARQDDFSDWPDHRELLARVDRSRPALGPTSSGGTIRFEPAQHVGIDFVYENGHDPATRGARMFEQTGGGVGVIDFDLDGRPDLYFTQGCPWDQGAEVPTCTTDFVDRLYRNREGRFFVDVTHSSRLQDGGFGQGLAVGDFNEDGWPDLYVAQIGRNSLHLNNGDGTFTDVTEEAGLQALDWTTSCVMVDLNGDQVPDLFDVNYVTGRNVYTLICDGRGCSPRIFEGTPDRLWIGRGDGTFERIDVNAPTAHAKGLGVLAFDVDQRGRPCLFIANDQVPNFFLRNVPLDEWPGIRLEEQGFLSGLAFNGDGLPMACMGIAADDVDGDGRMDLFVTNFKDEANTLYVQDVPGLFQDVTKRAGLDAPSLPFVGWGTQFLDADLDGDVDLIVVNGHIDDYRDVGGDYHMRPQFFLNSGGGRFVELDAPQAGSFFAGQYLARGLAKLDWNGDGLMDFAVSNMQQPALLVTNMTSDPGHFLSLRLHARHSSRDAIGSVVEVLTMSGTASRQLVGGDGYQASNEKLLQFGLGSTSRIEEVIVHWPSGASERFDNVPVNVTLELLEGSRQGLVWEAGVPRSFSEGDGSHRSQAADVSEAGCDGIH